jgi:phosphosulfolactate phosphohydrolase-like enzyme
MDVDVLPTREAMPDPPAEATYVVVDAYRFSTSVLTLLAGGAPRVRPATTLEEARADADRDGWVAGGEPHDEDPAFAVSNSPTRIAETDLDGRAATLYSINGAQAVDALDGREVYLGTTLNARALADAVDAERVVVVAVGSDAEPSPEDLVAAALIERHLRNDDVPEHVQDVYRHALAGVNLAAEKTGKDAEDAVRLGALNESAVVPRLVDGAFVDAT